MPAEALRRNEELVLDMAERMPPGVALGSALDLERGHPLTWQRSLPEESVPANADA